MSSSAEAAGPAGSPSRPGSPALAGMVDERRVLALSRRELVLVAALALVTILALVGGYLAVRGLFSGPEQRAAHAASLEELMVSVPVQRESRQEAVTLQATVTHPDSLPLAPPATGEGPAIVVQMQLAPGDTLAGGDLIAGISGQPLIALSGAFPLYCDLTRGDSGKDVTPAEADATAPEPSASPAPRPRTVTTVPRTLFSMIDTLHSTVLSVPARCRCSSPTSASCPPSRRP